MILFTVQAGAYSRSTVWRVAPFDLPQGPVSKRMDGKELGGRNLTVNEAKPRAASGRRDGCGGGGGRRY